MILHKAIMPQHWPTQLMNEPLKSFKNFYIIIPTQTMNEPLDLCELFVDGGGVPRPSIWNE